MLAMLDLILASHPENRIGRDSASWQLAESRRRRALPFLQGGGGPLGPHLFFWGNRPRLRPGALCFAGRGAPMNPHTASPSYGEMGGVLRLDNPVHFGERNKDWQRRMRIANYFRQFVHLFLSFAATEWTIVLPSRRHPASGRTFLQMSAAAPTNDRTSGISSASTAPIRLSRPSREEGAYFGFLGFSISGISRSVVITPSRRNWATSSSL